MQLKKTLWADQNAVDFHLQTSIPWIFSTLSLWIAYIYTRWLFMMLCCSFKSILSKLCFIKLVTLHTLQSEQWAVTLRWQRRKLNREFRVVLCAPSVRIWTIFSFNFAVLYKDIACLWALAEGDCFCPLTDGRPLTLDEIWGSVHASYQARLQEGPWDTITQQVRILWSFMRLGNSIYAWILPGLIPLLDTRKKNKNNKQIYVSISCHAEPFASNCFSPGFWKMYKCLPFKACFDSISHLKYFSKANSQKFRQFLSNCEFG